MSTLITGIGELTTQGGLGTLHNAALVLEGELIEWVGPATSAPHCDTAVDVEGRAVLPGWVDSHTHLLFAGDRSAEFGARMAGEPYAAGGIMTTVEATRAATDDELRANLRRLVAEAASQGTTCLETKTGYGLTVDDEVRLARLAAEQVDEVTYLGAHVTPPDTADYVSLAAGGMLTAVAPHVRWADAFCETGAFTADESREVLTAAAATGLGLRVHANQLAPGPGVQLAVELQAASADHCTHLTAQDIDALAGSTTVATLLPACDLSTRQPLPPARALLDAGARVALATNCNPGSSYTTSMPYCVATAVLQMHMTIDEALTAATRTPALSLNRPDLGHLTPGARADLQVLDAPSATHLAYRPGVPLTWAVWRKGTSSRPAPAR
ncbi:imidazolonepropionase [Actinokineospora sp. G85]|uniref:imidazolonepropionase n=1 Tax=Actinokineospora sp. G85 TaxID=3406626 RepID=UPI003C73C220